jgi:uncharacterized protein (TIGR03435 family)
MSRRQSAPQVRNPVERDHDSGAKPTSTLSSRLWGKEKGVKPGPELFRALEDQLGLTLKAAEEPVEFLAIDQAVRATLN